MTADKDTPDDTINLIKQAIIQFTPKLDRYLFENNEQSSVLVGRTLSETSDNTNSGYVEANPQGFVIPNRKITSQNDTSITIEKSYDQNSFIKGNGFDNKRSTLNYSEKTTFDKDKGLLNNSVVSQGFQYSAHPENDLLKTDFSINSNSSFKLLSKKTFDYDASEVLFGQNTLSSNSRLLYEMRTDKKLFEDFKGHTHDKWIHSFAKNIETHKRRHGVHNSNADRLLQNEVPIGSPCYIRLFPAPKNLFNYDLDLYVQMNLSRSDYTPKDGVSDGIPSVNPNRSYFNAEYALKFDIYKDEDPLLLVQSLILFSGNIKVNSTLLDMIPYFESFEKSFFKVLETLDNKTKAFVDKINSFLTDLKWDKKLMFQYTYNLAWIASITFEASVIFDFLIQTNINAKQLYDANKKALQDYYNSITTTTKTNAQAWIPNNIVLTNIPWTNLTNATLAAANKFNTSWNEYKNAVKDMRKNFLNSLTLNLTSTFVCHGNVNFDIRIKVNILFVNLGVKVNGTLIGFQTNALFYIDLLHLALDIKNPGKYFGVTFSFSVYAFTFRFWIYYEVSDCDWFGRVLNFMIGQFKKNSTRLLANSDMKTTEIRVYRNLGFLSFFNSVVNTVSNAVSNVIQTVTTDVVSAAKAVVTGITDAVQSVAQVVSNAFNTIKNWVKGIVDRFISFEEQFHLKELNQVFLDYGKNAICGALPGVKNAIDYPLSNPLVVFYYLFNLSVANWEVTYGLVLTAFSSN